MDWVIYACQTAYSGEVAEIISRCGHDVARLVDNLDPATACELGPTVAPAALTPAERELPTVVPLLTPGYRWKVVAEAIALGLTAFPALVDPTATVAHTAQLETGVVVNAAAVVGARTRLGRFVHVNRSASIGHDVEIAPFATVGPGCVLSGSVRVATGAFLGAGAVCVPEVSVGANAVVGAGAVVVHDLEPHSVAVGNPARIIKRGVAGYADAGVPDE
jgi:sugar O-acyltransferase (sialic acid O-acetyltransferase NeuD family)